MRTISSAIEAEKNKEQNIPVEFYQIYLDGETLYLVTWPKEVDFYDENGNPQTYYPAALSRRPIQHSSTLEVDRFRVQLDNVDRSWSATAANYDLQGVKVSIWKVFLELVDGDYEPIGDFSDKVELFNGKIDNYQITEMAITVEITSKLNTLDKVLPGRSYQARCPWVFGGEECGVDAPSGTGAVQDLSSDGKTLTLDSFPDTNWTHGQIKVGKDKRIITDYTSTTVTVEFPMPESVVGEPYELVAGCSKVKGDSSEGCSFWDNTQYFGGFSSIPKIRNIRQ